MKKTAIILIASLVLLLCSCQKKAFGYDIEFAASADSSVVESTKFEYNLEELESQLSNDDTYVYLTPKKTDYKVVEKFGFNINDYENINTGERDYMIIGSDKETKSWLEIDEFGAFSYHTGVQKTYYEMPYSDKDCVKIAKDYLVKYGLWNDSLLDEKRGSFNESTVGDGKTETVIGRGVNFFAQKVDGRGIAGNSRVTVEINGEGKVRSVTYNIREYEDRQEVDLISLKEAIQDIKENDAFIEVESVSDKLIFKNVHLSYWAQNRNEENLLMQPVYVFSGISITSDGSEEPFSITVQANEVP